MSDFPLKWPFPVLPTKAILQDLECLKGPALPPSLATHPWSHLPSWNSHRPHPSQYQPCYISHGGCPFTPHTANRIPVGPAPLCPCLPVLFFFSSLPLPHTGIGKEGSGCFLSLRDLLPQHCPWREHHVTPTSLPKQDLHVSEWWVTGVILLAPQDSVHEKI